MCSRRQSLHFAVNPACRTCSTPSKTEMSDCTDGFMPLWIEQEMQDMQMASLTCLTHSDVELQRAELEEAAQLLEKMQDVSDRERTQFEQVLTVSDKL